MNTWNFSGTLKNSGIKGTKYQKFWIMLELPDSSTLFINSDVDSDPNSYSGKAFSRLQPSIEKGDNIFIKDATLTNIKIGKKDDEGNWTNEEKLGIKVAMTRIHKMRSVDTPINCGLLEGIVTAHSESKLIIENRYRLPSTNEWKSRSVPVKIDESIEYYSRGTSLEGQRVFIRGEVNSTPDKIFVIAKQMILT